jgi:serine/threonine-protein kinase HipA
VIDELVVWFESKIVGRLTLDDDRFAFVYERAWLESTASFPISLTLPLRTDARVGGPAHAFFANLLPEGAARQAVCRRLGISEDNDFGLLAAIGGECAGALSLLAPDQSPDPKTWAYEEISRSRLRKLTSAEVVPLLLGGPAMRLSLAGAQDKLPVAVLDGKIHLPLNGAPSTHILKLPNERFRHLPVNEAYVLGLAQRVGMDVVHATMIMETGAPSLLVARYDREPSVDPRTIRRLHQEDICQALGVPPAKKYEIEGGPTLARATTLIRESVYRPLVDVGRVIAWQAFNVVAGNSDGHAKNLAITYSRMGEARLAPFYDLVSTREYPRIDSGLAMSVRGRRDPDELGLAQWAGLAKHLEVGERAVVDAVRDVAEACAREIAAWTKEFRARHGNHPVLQTLPKGIAKRARRTLRGLDRR